MDNYTLPITNYKTVLSAGKTPARGGFFVSKFPAHRYTAGKKSYTAILQSVLYCAGQMSSLENIS